MARQTRDRISRLFDQLDAETVLVLANAVYLKATWLTQFSEPPTTDTPFTTAAGQQVPARLMQQRFDSVRYTAGDGWQRICPTPATNSPCGWSSPPGMLPT